MEVIKISKKGVPRRDGTGKGVRSNKGRGGCATTQKTGKGKTNKNQRITKTN